jgi:hypothetical protein
VLGMPVLCTRASTHIYDAGADSEALAASSTPSSAGGADCRDTANLSWLTIMGSRRPSLADL